MLRPIYVLALIVGLQLLSGCRTCDTPEIEERRAHFKKFGLRPQDRQYIAAIRQNGALADPSHWNEAGDPYFSEILRGLTNSGKSNVVIFIHGGMNARTTSEERTAVLAPEILASGSYPIFINWRSSLFSSYWEHLVAIHQGDRKPVFGAFMSPFVFGYDMGSSVLRAPVVWARQIFESARIGIKPSGSTFNEDTREDDECDHSLVQRLWYPQHVCKANAQYTWLRNRGYDVKLGANDRPAWNDSIIRVPAWWVTLPTKLLTQPFIDGLGTPSWQTMLRRTELAAESRSAGSERDGPGGLYLFTKRLAAVLGTTNGYSIDLIGHSMGAIVANRLVEINDQEKLGLPITNIVYMAAACSIHDFSRTVVPYLQGHTNTHFYNLTLHPQNDPTEPHWGALELPARGSLLEWLDKFISNPLTKQDVTLGKFDNVILATRTTTNDVVGQALIPSNVLHQITIKAFPIYGSSQWPEFCERQRQCPVAHGDFSQRIFWNRAFWTNAPASTIGGESK
jgi:pimeloyl-ACP methyl ester carboxylesterase